MKKEQQDLAWACLPKEARAEIKKAFIMPSKYGYLDSVRRLMIDIYGHNLTSNTEPEEMLMVERKRVQEEYVAYKNIIRWANDGGEGFKDRIRGKAVIYLLDYLFGDKCLPDKPSIQVEPKKFFESDYGIGDKVVVCISSIGEPRKEVVTLIRQYQPQCEYNDYAKTWVIQTQDGQTFQSNEEHFEPYTETKTKDKSLKEQQEFQERILCNPDRPTDEEIYRDLTGEIPMETEEKEEVMEEKELNLCELLKGCEGTILYSRAYGDVSLNEIVYDDRPNAQEIKVYTPDPQSDRIWFLRNGRKHKNGEIDLWPSRAIYEKYPLDAYSAWMEWKEKKEKKKRSWWRAEYGCEYWYIGENYDLCSEDDYEWDDANMRYEMGNYFRTEEEAEQAAKAVRECLEKFHKDHTQS